MVVETVVDRGWSGVKNGELLRRAAASFDAFLTADQNLQYQQNLKDHKIRVVVLAAVKNRVTDLLPLLDEALAASERWEPGEVLIIWPPDHCGVGTDRSVCSGR